MGSSSFENVSLGDKKRERERKMERCMETLERGRGGKGRGERGKGERGRGVGKEGEKGERRRGRRERKRREKGIK